MSFATLKQDIIAHEQDDENATKMFSHGTRLDIEDWDDDWFMFYDEQGDLMYECEERPDDVLIFESTNKNVDSSAVIATTPYRPVPNMTPLSRRHLLL